MELFKLLNRKSPTSQYEFILPHELEDNQLDYPGIYAWYFIPNSNIKEIHSFIRFTQCSQESKILSEASNWDNRKFNIAIAPQIPLDDSCDELNSVTLRYYLEILAHIGTPFYVGKSDRLGGRLSAEWNDILNFLDSDEDFSARETFVRRLKNFLNKSHPDYERNPNKFFIKVFSFDNKKNEINYSAVEKLLIKTLLPITNTRDK